MSTESGYINEEIFYDWLKELFIPHTKPTADDPVILLLDNLASHFSGRILKLAADNHVFIINQPAHSSHFLQPLDKIFGKLKDGISGMSHAAQLVDGSAQVTAMFCF